MLYIIETFSDKNTNLNVLCNEISINTEDLPEIIERLVKTALSTFVNLFFQIFIYSSINKLINS